jgi:hypothetical protein
VNANPEFRKACACIKQTIARYPPLLNRKVPGPHCLAQGSYWKPKDSNASAVLLVVEGAEDVDGLTDAANLSQGLVDAVLPCIGAESQQHQGRRDDS